MAVHKIKLLQGLIKVSRLKCRSHVSIHFCANYRHLSRTARLAACTPIEKNIILMGPPGAGKTSVGRLLAQTLGKPIVDIDDDVLEKTWNMPVAEKLTQVGGERFLEEEGEAVCQFSTSGSVISLTGSNPLHAEAMMHLKRNGLVVYLDVDIDDILQRLARMKVNRIVGQEAATPMRDILLYRKQFYERWLDTRVFCGIGDTAEEVTQKVLIALRRYQDSESDTFTSTRSTVKNMSNQGHKFFSDVVVEGLAPDGGLYVPRGGLPKLATPRVEAPGQDDVPRKSLCHPGEVHSPHRHLPSRARPHGATCLQHQFLQRGSSASTPPVRSPVCAGAVPRPHGLLQGPGAAAHAPALRPLPPPHVQLPHPSGHLRRHRWRRAQRLWLPGRRRPPARGRAGVLPRAWRERDPKAPDDGHPAG